MPAPKDLAARIHDHVIYEPGRRRSPTDLSLTYFCPGSKISRTSGCQSRTLLGRRHDQAILNGPCLIQWSPPNALVRVRNSMDAATTIRETHMLDSQHLLPRNLFRSRGGNTQRFRPASCRTTNWTAFDWRLAPGVESEDLQAELTRAYRLFATKVTHAQKAE